MTRPYAFCVVLALGAGLGRAAPPKVGWMIYPYKVDRMSADQFQRLLGCTEAEYVGLQLMASPTYKDEVTKRRVAELVSAGKKIVLQIWFGAAPPISWERYNFPNIALDSTIREEFFAIATDPMIDYLGPKNLYAVHLLEETGMQFGWDVDMPGRPDRDDDGYETGNNFDNPANWVWGRCISGPNVLTIRKYNDLFRRETGLDMRYYPIWNPQEMERYKRWVQQTMEAGAHVQLAKHVHQKYPGLHVYAFNTGPALVPQSKGLDGQFIDPYTDTVGVYMSLRAFRSVMRPDQELVAMMWGNRDKPLGQRLPQQAACYIAGSNVLSTFGDREHQDDKWLNIVRDSVKPFLGRPVFRSRPKVLVLGGGSFGATLRHVQFWITGFAQYDVCHPWADDVVGLDAYDLVLNWGTWRKGLREWTRAGGVLMTVLPRSAFLQTEGYLEPTGKRARKTLDYRPDAWMREHLGLQESYKLELDRVQGYVVKNTAKVHQDQFIQVVRYGKGLVVLLPALPYVHAPWKYEPHWETFRQLLTDLCRGALRYRGKSQVADTFFDDPKLGNDYLKATSADGRTTVYVLLTDAHGPHKSPTSFVVRGKDQVSGRTNARLCQEHPVIIIDREAQ